MSLRETILAAMIAHHRDKYQHDVWLPMVRCVCGAVTPTSKFRAHIADEIAKAVEG